MVRQIKSFNITLENGKAAILSTAELAPGLYETMLASPDFGTEYKVLRNTTEKGAIADFGRLRKAYHVPPLSGKYAQLAKDLREAAAAGLAAAQLSDDGGTCNFDAATIKLKGWHQAKVEQAAKEAGVRCFEWNLWGSKSYVFPLGGCGQGNARTEAAETMSRHLKSAGYDAGVYYSMD